VELGHSVYDDGVNKAIQSPHGRWTKRCGALNVFVVCSFWIAMVYRDLFRSSKGLCGGCLVVEFIQSTIARMLISMKYMRYVYTNYGPVRLSYKPYFFSERTMFFSHNKSANSTFSHGLSVKRTKSYVVDV
jgi:hypothetical protein